MIKCNIVDIVILKMLHNLLILYVLYEEDG